MTFSWPPDSELGNRTACEEQIQWSGLIVDPTDGASHIRALVFLLGLASRQHVEAGGLLVHSAAVARGQDGFLFLGDSEAGKSTVARLSGEVGRAVLADDLNFVTPDMGYGFGLAACPAPVLSPLGYSKARPRLRAIFQLIKAGVNEMSPVPSRGAARWLVDAVTQAPAQDKLMPESFARAFQTACRVARVIPSFELRFTKTPDFWCLIDERLPPT